MFPENDITLIRHMIQNVITCENEHHRTRITINQPILTWVLLVWATSVGFIIVSTVKLRPGSCTVLLIVMGVLLLLIVAGIFYLAGSPVVWIHKRNHLPDNIPSPSLPVSDTDLVALSQTSNTLQQSVKDWLVADKDIRYEMNYTVWHRIVTGRGSIVGWYVAAS